jgi:hypothetical protein
LTNHADDVILSHPKKEGFAMEEKEQPRMIKCPGPGCSVELPEGTKRAQIYHMETNHPEIVAQRREKIGMPNPIGRFLW